MTNLDLDQEEKEDKEEPRSANFFNDFKKIKQEGLNEDNSHCVGRFFKDEIIKTSLTLSFVPQSLTVPTYLLLSSQLMMISSLIVRRIFFYADCEGIFFN